MVNHTIRSALIAGVITCVVVTSTHRVLAQTNSDGSAVAEAGDLILLRNGGMLRGTIVELVPGEFVVILVGGEARKIPADDLRYAGPYAERPKPPPIVRELPQAPSPAKLNSDFTGETAGNTAGGPVVHAPTVRLQLRGAKPGITFHVREGSGWKTICTAPCEVSMLAGTYQLAVSSEAYRPVALPSPIVLRGDSLIQGNHRSNRGVRVGGWVTLGMGNAVASVLLYLGLSRTETVCDDRGGSEFCHEDRATSLPLVVSGLGAAVLSTTVGLAAGLAKDHTYIRVVPLGTSTLQSRIATTPDGASRARVELPGLGLQGSFY